MSREGLQGLLAVVVLTQGLLPIGLRLFGSDGGPVWCLNRYLGTPAWVVAAAATLLIGGAAVLALEER